MRGWELLFGPVGGPREGVEAETGIERRCLVDEQALQMLRLAAGNGRRDGGHGDASIDAETRERQPPRTQMPLLQLGDQERNQSFECLGRGLGMGRFFTRDRDHLATVAQEGLIRTA